MVRFGNAAGRGRRRAGAYAEDLGGRLIALLKDADEELSAEQVAKLEALIEKTLPTID